VKFFYEKLWKKGASPLTINLEQSYLSGLFSELAQLGYCTTPDPLENVRKFTIAKMEWLD